MSDRVERAGLGLFLGLGLLVLALAPTSALAQSARFEQFTVTSPKAGEMAPDFTLLTVDNEPFNLMEAAADVPVVVEFGSFT
jgi:hypothetical protein